MTWFHRGRCPLPSNTSSIDIIATAPLELGEADRHCPSLSLLGTALCAPRPVQHFSKEQTESQTIAHAAEHPLSVLTLSLLHTADDPSSLRATTAL